MVSPVGVGGSEPGNDDSRHPLSISTENYAAYIALCRFRSGKGHQWQLKGIRRVRRAFVVDVSSGVVGFEGADRICIGRFR